MVLTSEITVVVQSTFDYLPLRSSAIFFKSRLTISFDYPSPSINRQYLSGHGEADNRKSTL